MNKVLSIIVVTADDHSRLRSTLESFSHISDQRIEFVFVFPDTDLKTRELIENSSLLNYVICQDKRLGIYSAMNLGLTSCTADYCMFLNSGDTIYSGANLQSMLSAITDLKMDWYITSPVTDWRLEVENGLENLVNFILQNSSGWISHQSVVMRSAKILELGGFDVRYKVAADTNLIIKFWKLTEVGFLNLRVSQVEKPYYSSIMHRRGRIEVALIVISNLRGSRRLLAISRIIRREFEFAFSKILRRRRNPIAE